MYLGLPFIVMSRRRVLDQTGQVEPDGVACRVDIERHGLASEHFEVNPVIRVPHDRVLERVLRLAQPISSKDRIDFVQGLV